MRRVFPIFAALFLASFLSGCVSALMEGSRPTDVRLKLESPQPQQYIARVALESSVEYPVPSDGRVQFTVPSFHNGCSYYFLGIETHDGSAEALRVIELRRGELVVRRLSLREIAKLPQDEAGFRIVRVRN